MTALAAQRQTGPVFRTDANYVRVDVFPTLDGKAVGDLSVDEFEVLEDDAPQRIEQFEHIVSPTGLPGAAANRREPNTVRESKQQAQLDEHTRVFVLFLDPAHVDVTAARNIGQPMANALTRLVGPDDLLGVMVPGMSARDITFARRTTAIEQLLARDWWGKRDAVLPSADPVENAYASCYPGIQSSTNVPATDRGVAQAMILRRREQQTLDALEDLVVTLRQVREERKTVLAISDGWLLYRPDPSLARPLDVVPPPAPPVGFDPRSGRLATGGGTGKADAALQACERDRLALSQLDDSMRLREIVDAANRSNTSFYSIDPRGLVAFDDNIVPAAGVGAGPSANPTLTAGQEGARLASRSSSLRQLAEGTDGLAVLGTNNLAAGLKRITDDLSSYYLLGYYSTGKLDGRFHRITVRVKRPGVSVRARRGYQALRASDAAVPAPTPSSTATATDDAARAAEVTQALAGLARSGRDARLMATATAAWPANGDQPPRPQFWVVSEIADRSGGARLEAALTTADGRIVSTQRAQIEPGRTSALLSLVSPADLAPGQYGVRIHSQGPASSDTVTVDVTLPPPGSWSAPLLYRSGPATAQRETPTADARYRRTERLRVDVPSGAATSAQLVDRRGRLLKVPVAFTTRTDELATSWASASLQLAPLAPGDYVLEFSSPTGSAMIGFQVVP